MDSLQECSQSKDLSILSATVSCVETLLSTLLQLSTGQCINHVYVTKINSMFSSLSSCDYKGEFRNYVNPFIVYGILIKRKLYFFIF